MRKIIPCAAAALIVGLTVLKAPATARFEPTSQLCQ
jgi:hypothetical protein